MALQGTLRDFALPEIFQLIGIQRKTGLLTLQNRGETVNLKFVEGQIVGAETTSFSAEDRLGELLLRNGVIDQVQLDQALRQQQRTLRRLGHILVDLGHIDDEQLIEMLRVQSSQVVYRLFRWREGTYRFAAADSVDYDRSHCAPISSETVLMEGARMMDEWPLIERRIRSDQMIVRLTAAGRQGAAAAAAAARKDEAADLELTLDADLPAEPLPQGPPAEERQVLALVDGRRTVASIRDRLALSEFDVYRILADLMNRGWLEEAGVERTASSRRSVILTKLGQWTAVAVVVGAAAAAMGSLRTNPWTPWRVLAADPTTDRLRTYVSIARLEQLERAIKVFQLDLGAVPVDLGELVARGYVRAADVLDPWGRRYGFEASPAGYRLTALDAAGEPAPELTISRRFTAIQQLVAPGAAPAP